MHRFRNAVILPAALLSFACAQPRTSYPHLSQDAVNRERQYQMRMAGDTVSAGNITAAQRRSAPARFKRVASRVGPAATQLCRELKGARANCAFDISMIEQKGLNAYADGKKIYVTKDMAAFTSSDNELANVIAHEYAHNIMNHVPSQQQNVMIGALAGGAADYLAASQGINTQGLGQQLGAKAAQLRYSKSFEMEADYVGMYIMERAGYDTAGAAAFWRKMAAASPANAQGSLLSTHPTSAERYVALNQAGGEINRKKSTGAPLRPDIRK